jgi:pyruvate/2-oxoglutarate dehydrogenase complex dihydrolipoamide dehydrogenase (E3) component
MVMIGAGPIATEMSQAFARLGIVTTVLQKGPRILPRDEPDLVDILVAKLRDEGVDLHFNVEIERVTMSGTRKIVFGSENGEPARWEGEELLVATGRRPNVEGLGLEEVGVKVGRSGIEVDERMRTAVPSIYAAGDVAGRFLFTHSAGYEAVRAVRDAFYPGKGKVTDFVPWCTFTDPELAHAGLTVAEAEKRYGDDVEVYRLDLSHSDRARADNATEGAIIVVTAKSKVVGAHILAPAAGEMIHELALAINQGLKLAEVASLIHVYPTLSTGIGQLAGEAAFEGARKLRWLVRKEK